MQEKSCFNVWVWLDEQTDVKSLFGHSFLRAKVLEIEVDAFER